MTNNFDFFEDVPVTPTKQEETEQKIRDLEREQLFIKTLEDVNMANNATSEASSLWMGFIIQPANCTACPSFTIPSAAMRLA